LHQLAERFYEDHFQVVSTSSAAFCFGEPKSRDAQNIHAIGDRANEVVLDVFEDILSKPGADVNKWRPRVEHAQIFQPRDLERIGRLGGWFAASRDWHTNSNSWPISHCERTADACVCPPPLSRPMTLMHTTEHPI
jgi:hypothetical protein